MEKIKFELANFEYKIFKDSDGSKKFCAYSKSLIYKNSVPKGLHIYYLDCMWSDSRITTKPDEGCVGTLIFNRRISIKSLSYTKTGQSQNIKYVDLSDNDRKYACMLYSENYFEGEIYNAPDMINHINSRQEEYENDLKEQEREIMKPYTELKNFVDNVVSPDSPYRLKCNKLNFVEVDDECKKYMDELYDEYVKFIFAAVLSYRNPASIDTNRNSDGILNVSINITEELLNAISEKFAGNIEIRIKKALHQFSPFPFIGKKKDEVEKVKALAYFKAWLDSMSTINVSPRLTAILKRNEKN